MYEYNEDTKLVDIQIPNVDIKLDTLPIKHPFVPRICDRQAHFFIWWGTVESDPDIYDDAIKNKGEEQWVNCDDNWKLEKGVAMLHIYNDEVIVGSIKYAGHMNRKSKSEIRNFIRLMYSDILECFDDRKIIIPSGSYFEHLHLTMNQKKIQHEPYHREIMQQFGFERQDKYWVRYANQVYRYH